MAENYKGETGERGGAGEGLSRYEYKDYVVYAPPKSSEGLPIRISEYTPEELADIFKNETHGPFAVLDQRMKAGGMEEIGGEAPYAWNSFDNGIEVVEGRREVLFKHRLGIVAGVTGIGGENSKYTENEDGIVVYGDGERLVVAVVDGAGGTARGREAAEIFCRKLPEYCRGVIGDKESVGKILSLLAEDIDKGTSKEGICAATLIILEELNDPQGKRVISIVGHVGDTGAIGARWPGGKEALTFGTKNQNVAQEEVDKGKIEAPEYFNHHEVNVLTNYLGDNFQLERAQLECFSADPQMAWLLYSDGVGDVVSQSEIEWILRNSQSRRDTPFAAVSDTYTTALARNNSELPFEIWLPPHGTIILGQRSSGAGDNITAVSILPPSWASL